MDRRSFLGTLVGGVATAAAVRTFPFRVFSFPMQIIVSKPLAVPGTYLSEAAINAIDLDSFSKDIPNLICSSGALYRMIKQTDVVPSSFPKWNASLRPFRVPMRFDGAR